MEDSPDGASRRSFLSMAGAVGASSALAPSALLRSMTGAAPAEAAPPWDGGRGGPNGRTVLVLGAGIAGLSAAYQLKRLGFTVKVLEAQDRPGGRNFTARRGTVVTELTASGEKATQTCTFDDGLYINLGPGRISHHHRRVLAACRRFGIALEPYIMQTSANLYQGGKGAMGGASGTPQPQRRVDNDTRGHLAHLLARAVEKGGIDGEFEAADRAALLQLLVAFGDLDPGDYAYDGSTRSGYRAPLSVHQLVEKPTPLALPELLAAEFWNHRFYQPTEHLWQPTMFQPVGGMDRIVDGFTSRLRGLITYDAEVTRVGLLRDGVDVTWVRNGTTHTERADYCLSNIPLPILHTIDKHGFSQEFSDAIAMIPFAPTCKVGWQANRRFWESDKYQVYGGISWIDHIIVQLWYPSNDYFGDKGTLTGCYNYDDGATRFGNLDFRQRLATAREGATRLHSEFAEETVVPSDKGISIAWQKVPHQAGGWPDWNPANPQAAYAYSTLLTPAGRFHVIGDQVSSLPAWQEGALMSAEYVVRQLLGLERDFPPAVHNVPDSHALATGSSR